MADDDQAAENPRDHSATIRLLGEQVATIQRYIAEDRIDIKTLEKAVEALKVTVAVLQARDEEEICRGCQKLQIEVARIRERATLVAEVLAAIEVLGIAFAAYLGSR